MKLPLIALAALLPLTLAARTHVRGTSPHLAFTEFDDDIGGMATRETRLLFTSRDQYEAYFDHRAPVDVDWSRDWVVFYSAGLKSTDGFAADVVDVLSTEAGHALKITTTLNSPGPDCRVPRIVTKPYVLVRFAIPTKELHVVRFMANDFETDCGP